MEGIVVSAIVFRVGVHHKALPQGFVHLHQHGDKAFPHAEAPGIAVCRHDGVIVPHGGKIGAFAVQVLHHGLRQLRGLQGIFVKVLALPVGEASLYHLCHGLVIVLVEGEEQVGFLLEFVRVIPGFAEVFQGVVVNIGGVVRLVVFPVVVLGKGLALPVEQGGVQAAGQFFPDECPQVCVAGAGFGQFCYGAVFLQECFAHQVMFHAPAQVDGHVVVGVDGVDVQPFLFDALYVAEGIVHSGTVVILADVVIFVASILLAVFLLAVLQFFQFLYVRAVLLRSFQGHCGCLPAEGVEVRPG